MKIVIPAFEAQLLFGMDGVTGHACERETESTGVKENP